MRKFCIMIVALFLLGACTKEAATVGPNRITDKDISLRAKVAGIYYPGSGQEHIGLAQLIKGNLALEVLKSLGHTVDENMIEAEARRIDEKTAAPEMLEKIKAVYGSDREAYLRTYVQVIYAERVLYNKVFPNSSEIHRKELALARSLLEEALKSPEGLMEAAGQKGLEAKKLLVSAEEGIRPYGEEAEEGKDPSGQAVAARLIKAVSGLAPSEVYPKLIEWLEGNQIVRFIAMEGDAYVVETAWVPRRDYNEWFWEQASQVPVHITNPELKKKLLDEIGWAERLNLS